jgi:hypothetical protein
MRTIEPMVCVLAAAAALAPGMAVLAADPATPAANEISVWEQHQSHIDYYSQTRSYGCEVLEQKVRKLLRQLGARADLQVQASGCAAGTFSPSHVGTLNVTFYALAPSSTPAAADGVPSRWVTVDISPQQSRFLDGGDCELMRSMQAALSKDLSWRALQYTTSCFPGTLTINDFQIKGLILEQAAKASG